jgi:hypothetical protein
MTVLFTKHTMRVKKAVTRRRVAPVVIEKST